MANKWLLIIIAFFSSFLICCRKNCTKDAALIEFKNVAWNNLLSPDTIWFPEKDINIIEDGNNYSAEFTTYGKKFGTYYEYKLDMVIECKHYGWKLVSQDFNFINEINDDKLIKVLDKRLPSEFIGLKK